MTNSHSGMVTICVSQVSGWLREKSGQVRFAGNSPLGEIYTRWRDTGDSTQRDRLLDRLSSFLKASGGAGVLVLEENPDIPPTGQFVGLNGIGYILRPGEPIDVPLGVKEVLDNAIIDVPQVDPSTQQIIGTRSRMRYPYRLA